MMQTGAWFIMFYLIYYNISYRLNILTLIIGENNNKSIDTNKRIKRLRMCKRLFDQICLVSADIKSTFSFSVLVILTLLIIICSACLFFCIYTLVFINNGLVNALAANFIKNILMTLIILIAANSPIIQVKFRSKSSFLK